jgi:hypothetical protein
MSTTESTETPSAIWAAAALVVGGTAGVAIGHSTASGGSTPTGQTGAPGGATGQGGPGGFGGPAGSSNGQGTGQAGLGT